MSEHKFRCHFTIVIEQTWKLFLIIIISMLSSIFEIWGDDNSIDEDSISSAVFILVILMAIVLITFIYHLILWSKTYISIEDNAIVISRNTLNRRKNVIGIQNISNINTEQNLFEIIFQTATVKLDTNSLSTANKTDLKIILKKEKAELFKEQIMEIMENQTQDTSGDRVIPKSFKEIKYDNIASTKETFLHGIYSLNLFAIIIFIFSLIVGVETLEKLILNDNNWKNIISILISFVTILIFFISALSNIMNGFIKFYNFKSTRINDKLYLEYGLLKKVNYTIPIDKINAIHIRQSLLARIFQMYCIELVNVGMSDDEGKNSAFLTLYCKKSQVKKQLSQLLPEFLSVMDKNVPRQPFCSWVPRIINLLLIPFVFIVGTIVVQPWLEETPVQIFIGAGTLYFIIVIFAFFYYFTEGLLVKEDYLTIARGCLQKTYTCIKYEKIQSIHLKQNILTRKLGISKGNVSLLANSANLTHRLPYFYSKETEYLKLYCCKEED